MDRVVIDSGPLFTVLTIHFAQMFPSPAKAERLLHGVDPDIRRSPSLQKACLELFSHITCLLTTSNVIGEIQGLQSSRLKLKGSDFKNFWQRSMVLLADRGFDEKLFSLIEDGYGNKVNSDAITEVGPTDAGLIDLARREQCALLTDDERTLAPLAYKHLIDCKIFKAHLR